MRSRVGGAHREDVQRKTYTQFPTVKGVGLSERHYNRDLDVRGWVLFSFHCGRKEACVISCDM